MTTMTDIRRHPSLEDANSDISSNIDFGSLDAAEGEQESDAKADDEDTGPDSDDDEEDLDTDERELSEQQLEIDCGSDRVDQGEHDLENNNLTKNNDSPQHQQSAIKMLDKSNKRPNGDMGLISPNMFNNNKSNQRKLANRLNKSLMSLSSSPKSVKKNSSPSGKIGSNNKSTIPSNTVSVPHIGNRKRKSYPSIVSNKLNKMPAAISHSSSTVTNQTSTGPLLMTTLPSVLTSSPPSSHVTISSSSLGSILMPNVTDQMDLSGTTQLNSINTSQSNCFTGNGGQQNPQLTQAAFAAATAALATAAAAAGISVNQLITQVDYSFFLFGNM